MNFKWSQKMWIVEGGMDDDEDTEDDDDDNADEDNDEDNNINNEDDNKIIDYRKRHTRLQALVQI